MKTLIKHTDFVLTPPNRSTNLYSTLKSTRFAVYVPHLSIEVETWILRAVLDYLRLDGFAGIGLEEYLGRIGA